MASGCRLSLKAWTIESSDTRVSATRQAPSAVRTTYGEFESAITMSSHAMLPGFRSRRRRTSPAARQVSTNKLLHRRAHRASRVVAPLREPQDERALDQGRVAIRNRLGRGRVGAGGAR